MFSKLFKNKKEESHITVYAPLDGELIPLEEVPDPVFSEKMMGDGVAIMPKSGTITSPVNGKILQVFPTKHAIGIQTEDSTEILIHIGLETVNLKGEGFTAHVNEGDTVSIGDRLITFEEEVIMEKAKSIITPIIITKTDKKNEIRISEKKRVSKGHGILFIH